MLWRWKLSLAKKVYGEFRHLQVENELYTLRTPKLLFKLIHPGKEQTGKYTLEKAVLDVIGTTRLIRTIKFSHETDLFKSYKGNLNKKLNRVVARIFSVKRKDNLLLLTIKLAAGEQSFVVNKTGTQVPGTVKPIGWHTLRKASIALTPRRVLLSC